MQFLTNQKMHQVLAIEAYAAKTYDIDLVALKAPGKSQHLARVRFIVWRALKETGGVAYTTIGRRFNRDHTTVISGVQQAKKKPLSAEYDYFMATYRRGDKNEVQTVDKMGTNVDNSPSKGRAPESYQTKATAFHHVLHSEEGVIEAVLVKPGAVFAVPTKSNPHNPQTNSSNRSLKGNKRKGLGIKNK